MVPTATCDILIGEDGIKSVVRKTMLQEAAVKGRGSERETLKVANPSPTFPTHNIVYHFHLQISPS
ncbi:hypothetical protein B0F90DRAFT_1732763 [Multifurca ochricompacta]|uniref:Uncharacterized protein n=1 Tax=Multifurca ochricompacta TaxID=376703 RepID=A0AAD4M245_9AGAM|nr:hypothetical protein B0F90DRAFT_1732763 [Multifurca ochricompacta]